MARGGVAPERDRFDRIPPDLARVGAHRAPARRAGAFRTFAWAALATGVLVGIGVLGLGRIEQGVSGTERSAASSSAQPAATVDPAASVVVLNATTTTGLAAKAAARAKADDWSVGSTANADTQDVKVSTVYYSTASQVGAARGLAKSLGIARVERSDRFDVQGRSRLTVVLGSDYAG